MLFLFLFSVGRRRHSAIFYVFLFLMSKHQLLRNLRFKFV
jgi:hypothetical protein